MQDNNKSFIGGLVLGSVLGTIFGLLIAPDSGAKTRQNLKNKIGDLKGYLMDEIGVVSKKVKATVSGRKIKANKKRK